MEEFIEQFDEGPSVEINADTKLSEIPEWDSLVALSLIVLVSENYGKSIDGDTINSCITVGDLFEMINA
ncbi:MAG: acyl carrier protein [Bacteroidota bacterium]|nr:acyl carrier protein [Bacteroidota bacterium]